jgi:hypothetical protein
MTLTFEEWLGHEMARRGYADLPAQAEEMARSAWEHQGQVILDLRRRLAEAERVVAEYVMQDD